jgi:hypothetical protein
MPTKCRDSDPFTGGGLYATGAYMLVDTVPIGNMPTRINPQVAVYKSNPHDANQAHGARPGQDQRTDPIPPPPLPNEPRRLFGLRQRRLLHQLQTPAIQRTQQGDRVRNDRESGNPGRGKEAPVRRWGSGAREPVRCDPIAEARDEDGEWPEELPTLVDVGPLLESKLRGGGEADGGRGDVGYGEEESFWTEWVRVRLRLLE